jgi:hypothetical protein
MNYQNHNRNGSNFNMERSSRVVGNIAMTIAYLGVFWLMIHLISSDSDSFQKQIESTTFEEKTCGGESAQPEVVPKEDPIRLRDAR